MSASLTRCNTSGGMNASRYFMGCERELIFGFFRFEEGIEDGEQEQGEEGCGDKAADDDDGEGAGGFSADAGGNRGGEQAKGGHEGGHQHGAEAGFGALED